MSPLVYQNDEAAEDYLDDEGFLDDIVGTITNPIGAIGKLLSPPPPKPPMATIMPVPPPPGVTNAMLNTPAGNATLKLPESVVSTETFRRYQDETTQALNLATARLRATEGEVKTLRERVTTVVTQTQQDVEKTRREGRTEIRRLRRRMSSDSMMSMMMGMMASRRQQDEFDGHTHGITAGAATTQGPSNAGEGDDNNLMMVLPFMMMGQGEGRDGGDDDGGSMMMMAMMMAMGK